MSFNVLGIGEVLWDLLPGGPQLGGAPANFAYHARALGARAGVVTRVGRDRLGQDIRKRFELLGIPVDLVQLDPQNPTGTVTVELMSEGVPHFTIKERVAWDQLLPTDAALDAARRAEAICFGSLAQRCEPSRNTIQKLVAVSPPSSLRIFDVNLRQNFYSREILERSLLLANVLKLNDAEIPIISSMFNIRGTTKEQVEMLAFQFSLKLVALTRGPGGSLLYANGQWSEQQGIPVDVKDTVGAGDSFTAALALALLRGVDLQAINAVANDVASYVCSCAGATPVLPARFRAVFDGRDGLNGMKGSAQGSVGPIALSK